MVIDLPPQTAQIIQHIANLQGVSMEQFFINSAYEKALEFAYTPNKETLQAIDELESGKGAIFANVDDLMVDLNA